jgi:hypothetical protein
VRSDGSLIETTAWSDGPAAAPPDVASRQIGAAPLPGEVAAPAAPAPLPAAAPADPAAGSLMWFGLGGVGLLLAAAVVVVLTLRR